MNNTEMLRKRFCKDNKISVQTYSDPYFTNILYILGKLRDYNEFMLNITHRFRNSEDYFQLYNETKDSIIEFIKGSQAFQMLNTDDMNKYAVKTNIRQGDVFKEHCIGSHFISIDIKKANFSSLVNYGLNNGYTFYDSYNWDGFISQFTDLDHIKESKYIRQVVFGNCNPKRQVGYQKYLTYGILNRLDTLFGLNESNRIMALCNDEIVLNAEDLSENTIIDIQRAVEEESDNTIPLRFEYFLLGKVKEKCTYVKMIKDLETDSIRYELKCTNPVENLFVTAKLYNIETTDNCLVFDSQYGMARLLEKPNIEINWDKQGE